MSDLYKPNNNPLFETAGEIAKEGNPTSVITAIALGVIAVGGMAIKAIR